MDKKKIVFLIVFFVFFIHLFTNVIPDLFSVSVGWKKVEVKSKLKETNSFLNQILKKEVEVNGEKVYENLDEFVKMFHKYFFYEDNNIRSDYKTKKYNLKSYKNKRMLHYYDKFSFVIMKFEDNCKIIDVITPKNSSCILEVDLNTIVNGPNKNKFYSKNPNKADRYLMIINSRTNEVVIPEKYKNMK